MIRTLTAAAILAFAALPAHADELSDLKDRYIAWRGGPAFQKAVGLEAEGRSDNGTYSGAAHRWQTPDRHREAAAFGAFVMDSYTGPDGAWTRTLSGQIEAPSAAEQTAVRRRALLTFDDALQGADGAKLSLGPAETLDGKAVRPLRVAFDGPDYYELLILPATGELVALRQVEDGRPTLIRYSDWRMVEDVRMAFGEVQRTAEDPLQITYRFSRMDIDPSPAATVWTRPQPVRIYAFKPGIDHTAPVAFDFFAGNRVYIPASVNGLDTHVMLDSGAEATVLDQTWAAAHGIKPSGKVVAVGTGGVQEAQLASGVTIRIGDLELKNLTVALIDLSAIEKLIGRPMPVVLGKEVFNELVVDLDFQGKTIAFHEPASFKPPPGAAETPILTANGLRSVPVSIEGRPPVQMDFDIGNGSPLLVYSAFWKPAGLLDDGRPQSAGLSGAVGGLKERKLTTVRTVTFGGTTFTEVPAVLFEDNGDSSESNRTLGNIGLPILSRFRLFVDYPNDRLWLIPNAKAVPGPFTRDLAGLRAEPHPDGAKVTFIAPGSPAAAAGLAKGDIITELDGTPLKGATAGIMATIRAKKAGDTLVVRTADGRTRQLELKPYY